MHVFEFSVEKSQNPSQFRIFWISFITIFIVVTLHYLGVKPPRFSLIKQIPLKADTIKPVRTKLHIKPSTFKLNPKTNLIRSANASGLYEEAPAYIAADLNTGQIYLQKNISTKLPIASLTKIMSAVVALDLASPTDVLTVTAKAAHVHPTSIGVVPGQKMTLDELLHAALMTSANDAIEVIRENIDIKYGHGVFVKAMNEKAAFLKLFNTHFTNPQGYDDRNHYSSAEDLTLLTSYALTTYPLIAEIVKTDYYLLPKNSMHKQFDLFNWNGLLGVYPGVKGVKIGNTDSAKTTTIVVSERQGKKLIAIVLGAPGIIERDEWAADLLDKAYAASLELIPVSITREQLRTKYATWRYWN